MYKISVVVTTYNRKYEVRRALDSIYAQTEQPYEVLLIDDGSKDGTKEYIESFYFKGLRYFEMSERRGPGAARNYGIRHALGDYVAFLDSDNEWYKTKLEEFSKVFQDTAEEWDVIYSKYKKHVQFETVILPEELGKDDMILRNEIWLRDSVDASSSIYKKSFLEETGFFSEQLMTNIDWELLLRGSKKRKIRIKKVDKVLTENWTMFDGVSENRELERKERARIFSEYANELFAVITENSREIEKQYNAEREHYKEVETYYKAMLVRKDSFYQLMSKWMKLKLEGQSLAEKLAHNGYSRIAIYGAGRHGMFLYQDLLGSRVRVVYFIDRNKKALQGKDIPVYLPVEELPDIDAIVVSPYLEFELIKQDLKSKCNYKLIALNELIDW